MLTAVLEEILSPTLSTVVGMHVCSWLLRDIKEMQDLFLRKAKTELKKEHIRKARQATEEGIYMCMLFI